jgi:AraC-like DNA-binding protein
MTATISSQAVKKMLEAVRELGAPVEALCARAGIDPKACDDKDARVPIARHFALWEAVLDAHRDRDPVLRIGRHFAPQDYGLVGFACINSPTLERGLEQAVRYLALWTDEPRFALAGGTLEVHWRGAFGDRPGTRCVAESSVIELVNNARAVLQAEVVPVEVAFAHPAPVRRAAYDDFFGVPVRFGASGPAARLRFAGEHLAAALPKADPALGALLAELASKALAQRPLEDPLLGRVRELIAAALQRGSVTAGFAARSLAMGERTLRRKLETLGTSFHALTEATREELARRHAADLTLPLSEVAFLLGFSEPSAFHRAFKRWTGMTPRAFRAGHVARKVPRTRGRGR